MARSWMKGIMVGLAAGTPIALWARTSGPDSAGYILMDSVESDGPPHVWVDASSGEVWEPGATELPFEFSWGGIPRTSAVVGADGSLMFEVGASSCPGVGDWAGLVTGGGGDITHRTIGRFPNRGLLWDWGEAQIMLMERRSEAVLRLAEASDDQFVGAQAVAGSGLPWACGDASLISNRSAWVSDEGVRSVAALRTTDHLEHVWWGSRAAEFFGESVSTGDVNADGLTDVLVGEPEGNVAFLFYGHRAETGTESGLAGVTFSGDAGGRFGHVVTLVDMDGDGRDDVVVTAPNEGSGAAHVFLAADGLDGVVSSLDASNTVRAAGDLGTGGMGYALAVGDVTGDGSKDLVLGAPNAYLDSVLVGGVWIAADRDWSEPEHWLEIEDGFWGDTPGGQAGAALHVADFDGDGIAEIVASDPYVDSVHSDTGRVFIFSAGAASDTLLGASTLVIDGVHSGALFGTSLATGDLDASGSLDLVVGAVGRNDFGSRTGAVSVFLDVDIDGGFMDSSTASRVIVGSEGAQATGASVAVGQLEDDAADELIIGATGGIGFYGGGGMVAIFRDLPEEDESIANADHRLIAADGSGDVGADVAIASDLQGDGYPDLIVAAPLDTPGLMTAAGAVWVWPFLPAYLDDDDDGFVSQGSGGLDCDDLNALVNPNASEVAANLVDDDCDGWVDDVFIERQLEAGWEYDIQDVLGVSDPDLYDFEDSEDGAGIADHYSTRGMTLHAAGVVRAQDDIWGAAPVDSLGARVTAGGDANDLVMSFGSPIDAIGLRILDAEVLLRMDAVLDGELVVDGFQFRADGPDTPGGIFQGFTFAEPVDTVRIAASTPNGWGVDDVAVVFAASSDRDGDGLSAEDGDCDDFDAAVYPGAEEVLGDGADNDCDGVIDAGYSDVFLSEGSFVAAISIVGERIDFEEPDLGSLISDFYTDRGVSFADSLEVVTGVESTPARDLQAALSPVDSIVLNFTENQPAVAFWLLDSDGIISLEARRDGVVLYENTLPPGTVGFVGMGFPVPADTLVIQHSISGDEWGIDDLTFAALGLDDADGDGFTEAEGDCDDTEASAYPGGVELWYDGVDGDCLGDDDFDADGDGHSSLSGGGFDCDDFVAETHPGAEDDWYDGVDSDCMGDDDFDLDGDGHTSYLFGGTDCDDSSASISPDAEEVFYDDVDDDCDPTTDFDADGDGFAAPGFPGAIGVYGVGDCDDAEEGTHPGAEETWYDGLDSDCAGDDDFDADGDGHIPLAYGGDDCDDESSGSSPDEGFDECYDGLDSDCDGHSDFDCDRDGYDDVAYGGWDCDDADGTVFPGDGSTLDGPDLDCDGFVDASAGGDDCDDTDAEVHPGATDLWYDGRDDDCDGADDFDRDGDGYRVAAWADDPSIADCDDGDETVHPGVLIDDCLGGDEDCDGEVDEDCIPVVDTSSPTDTEPSSADTGSSDGSDETDTNDVSQVDTGDSVPEDTGAEEAAPTSDTSSDSGADSSEVSGDIASDSDDGAGRKPGKGRECGCYSAQVAPSWIWMVPLWVAVFRRRLQHKECRA